MASLATLRRRCSLSAAFLAALVALVPARATSVCSRYEYQLGLRELLAWPERGLYLAHLSGSYGQVGEGSRWFVLDERLRRLADLEVDPSREPDLEFDPGERAALGAHAEELQRIVREAAAASPPEPQRYEGFDAALTAALTARGALALQRSTECLRRTAPCVARLAGLQWTCEQRSEDLLYSRGAGLQSVGCYEDRGRTLVETRTYAITGSDCDTIEQWVRYLPPLERGECPECRTGYSADRRPVVVPVLGLARGAGPLFTPLGFDTDGRLLFRHRAAAGGPGTGSFDPVTRALRTRGVTVPSRRSPPPRRIALGGSFKANGTTYAVVEAGPADGSADVLELVAPGAQPFRPWTVTVVSDRAGTQPLALVPHETPNGDDLDPAPSWLMFALDPGTRHLVAVAAVQHGDSVELAFFSASLRDEAFSGRRDPPPAWSCPPNEPWEPAKMIGFSRSGLFAYLPGDPERRDDEEPPAPEPTVVVVRLSDGAVLARAPLSGSASTLQRHRIIPGLFEESWGYAPLELHGASVVLTEGKVRKVLGTLAPDELFRPHTGPSGSDLFCSTFSPFAPLAAVLVETPKGLRVFGARLEKGSLPPR